MPARDAALAEGLRVWAEVDLDALTANVHALKRAAGNARLMVVVKANAYGHGAELVSQAAVEAGAWGLGVASLEEGTELRRAGIEAPIVVLSSTRPAQAEALVDQGLSVTIATFEMANALSEAAVRLRKTARVHVKVETGMHRFGAEASVAQALAEHARDLAGVEVEGVASHLATADEEDRTLTQAQHAAFRSFLERVPWVPMAHIANTAGLLSAAEMEHALVRCGMGVYGYRPAPGMQTDVPLTPVLSLRSRVARVEELAPGEGVGYGMTWRASKPSRVALVLAGYGDGLRLAHTKRGEARVRGQRAPYVGRVMMDMLTLDVTHIPDVRVDDEVTLLGSQGDLTVDANDMAERAGTISYEVLTGLMERVPRFYSRNGRIVGRQDLLGLRRMVVR